MLMHVQHNCALLLPSKNVQVSRHTCKHVSVSLTHFARCAERPKARLIPESACPARHTKKIKHKNDNNHKISIDFALSFSSSFSYISIRGFSLICCSSIRRIQTRTQRSSARSFFVVFSLFCLCCHKNMLFIAN